MYHSVLSMGPKFAIIALDSFSLFAKNNYKQASPSETDLATNWQFEQFPRPV
jgi:hypothetical protein